MIVIKGIGAIAALLATTCALADIDRVRVVNQSGGPIYIHVGGHAYAQKIEPGKWKIFYYPFKTQATHGQNSIETSRIVATSGGQWVTDETGYTHLEKPSMCIVLDYGTPEYSDKKGNRVWAISKASGFDPGCKVAGLQQPVSKNQ